MKPKYQDFNQKQKMWSTNYEDCKILELCLKKEKTFSNMSHDA